jgi:excisionase family DNA binding protein
MHRGVLAEEPRGGLLVTYDHLLTVREVAERLALKEATIRAWLLARRIASVRVGRRAVRIPCSEVDRVVAEGFVPARGRQ